MRTAALFPGQGSQTDDMRDVVERSRPDLLELASAELEDDIFARASESTEYAQPAIYCASLAGWERVGAGADLLAGHSLGELTALAAAGSLDHRDGFHLAVLRGRAMQRAGLGRGGMLALGAGMAEARALADAHGLTVANDNSPEQTVLSGDADAIDAVAEIARDDGLRVKRLAIRGAFHTPAMASARRELERALAETEFAPARLPVFSCVTAAPLTDPRRALAAGLTSPVRWRETMLTLRDWGTRRFVEVGPGRVLTSLVKRTLDGVEATTVEGLEAARV
jgi:[acyl-carrier-protein] S-malonyltransferase